VTTSLPSTRKIASIDEGPVGWRRTFLPGLSDEVETAAQQTPARYSRKAATDIK
jgi:hypothetical protein